jgi:putative CocE/NonD family hydrolase
MKKNIFVFGLNESNRNQMMQIPGASEKYLFHSLLAVDELVEAEAYDFPFLLEKARHQLADFQGSIDGIATFWDFPSIELLSILCQEYDLPGPSVLSVVKCAHKYYSRTMQKEVIPDYIPDFQAVNPFSRDPLSKISLAYPFFLKPVKSYASVLSFYIGGPEDFLDAISNIRDEILRYGEPYNQFLQIAGVDTGEVNGHWCIAEGLIGGKMCTVEGYSHNGKVNTFGLIDSHRFPGRTTFSRYQYPSTLPVSVRKRIDEITRKIITYIGYDNGAFNIEFFYDKHKDKVWLLEINPRISQSHSNLFYKVDGMSNHKVMLDLALGQDPQMPKRKGAYRSAAKFYIREFKDGIVSKVPDKEQIEEVQEEYPDTLVLPDVNIGTRLSDLQDQEPYSYRLGVVYMGGHSQQDLLDNFRNCKTLLDFRIRDEYPQRRKKWRPVVSMDSEPAVLTKFPYRVEVVEHVPISMRDGTVLSARLWKPEISEKEPVPAILEYIPYRKRDHTRRVDEMNYNYLAGHGYACLRVDMRGSGDSEGILEDEYLPLEQQDGLDILEWIEHQPWSNGDVGMVGISWGGFNSLQMAALQPSQLKAIITVCSTDDRYTDDVHYMGGTMLADNLSWASVMFARNSQPPDPEIMGDKWYENWLARLEGSDLWLKKWMEHPHRDAYWVHGSVNEDYDAIKIPTLAVGGWADGYSNAIFRLLEHLKAPVKGIIGPWSHIYPQFGKPGPAIGFLQEQLRWWDYWLKGIDNGVSEDPDLTVFQQNYTIPAASRNQIPGQWLSINSWKNRKIKTVGFYLDHEGGLTSDTKEAPENRKFKIESPLSVGLFGGKWCSYSATPDLPHDQREDDGGSLIFESEKLRKSISIMGAPCVELEVSANKSIAMIAVRLSDILPDDKATRITYGLLNLTHRNGSKEPTPLHKDKKYKVKIYLNEIAQVIPKGHRLRIAISSSYFPVAWPAPEPARISIYTGSSKLILPVLPSELQKYKSRKFQPPVVGPCGITYHLSKPLRGWMINRDMIDETTTVEVTNNEGKVHHDDIGMDVAKHSVERYTYQYDDYKSIKGEVKYDMLFEREGWKVETQTQTILTSTKYHFHIRAILDAYLNGARVFSKSWNEKIVRKLV